MLLVILVLSFAAVSNNKCKATPSPCNTPTDIYYQYIDGDIPKSSIYLENTYLPILCGSSIDPCTPYKDRKTYIKILEENNIQCSGPWCIDGSFSCGKSGNTECWQVEHIIDQSNSDLVDEGYDVNILGNVIMAYGKWNVQIGQRIWPIVEEEKSLIYGNIYNISRNIITGCVDSDSWSSTKTDHRICDIDISVPITGVTIFLIIVSVIVTIETIVLCICYRFYRNNKLSSFYVESQIDESMSYVTEANTQNESSRPV